MVEKKASWPWVQPFAKAKVVPLRPILIATRKGPRTKRLNRKKVTIRLNDGNAERGLFRIRDWQDKDVQRWLKLMVIPMTYEIWAFPFRLALGVPSSSNYLWTLDLVCDGFFWFDGIVSVTTIVPASSELEEAVTDFGGIVVYFLLHRFPTELLPSMVYLILTPICASLMPSSCSSGFLLNAPQHTESSAEDHLRGCLRDWTIWVWWASTLLRIVPRTRRLSKYFETMESDLNVSINMLQLFKYSMIIFMTAHWVGCIYFFIARLQALDYSTWVGRLQNMLPTYDCHTAPLATQYVICLYRGFSALTVAYASSMPGNALEILFTFFVIMVQVWQVGVILGAIINYTVERDPVAEAHKKLMEDLQLFVDSKELPEELTGRVFNHFDFQHKKAVENQSSHIDLPRSLELKVANSKFRAVLDRCSARGQVFHDCNPQFIKMLMTRLRVVFLMSNESVFKKGDMARELYFVYRGACTIANDEKVKRVVRHDAPDSPAILGEVPFFFGVLHGLHCRADADGEVQLLLLSKSDGEELFANYPEQLELIRKNLLVGLGLDESGTPLVAGGESTADPDDLAISEAVCEAIKSNADETFTSLTQAARVGDVEELQKLIRKGANINHVDYDGRGALAMAAVEGNFKVVEVLLQSGVDRNSKNRWGQTPLQEAITARQGPVVELLLQWRARINSEQNSGALCSASSTGDLEQLKRLVENKADVNHGDYDQRSPLHLAAAEGHDKIAEYLLDQKADPCVKDRWGCTPLQEAVRSGRSLLAELIMARGGVLPADVGSVQICTAASKGDVSQIRLLHLCGVKSDVGDYDFRCPLHLASAEAKVLAVSMLLVFSANPNSTDRWGCTPMDDAMRGGTLYHKFCARLLLAWGGTLGVKMRKTIAGQAFVKELEGISMEEVRWLIRRLIDAGCDRRIPISRSVQEIHTTRQTTMKCVEVAKEMKESLADASQFLREKSTTFHEVLNKALEALLVVSRAIDNHSANQRRKSTFDPEAGNDGAAAAQTQRFLGDGSPEAADGLQVELKELLARRYETNNKTEDGEEGGQGLDSDEEDQLHAELDRLVEMQERVEAMGGNQNKYMASVFQRVCLQITDIEGMFNEVVDVFRQASSSIDMNSLPSVTMREFVLVVDILKMTNVSQSAIEAMFEQGFKYDSYRARRNSARCSAEASLDPAAGGDLDGDDCDEGPSEDAQVSMTSIIIGSESFRQEIIKLDIDEPFCRLASGMRNLSEGVIKLLSRGGKPREIGKGDPVPTDSLRVKAKYSSRTPTSSFHGSKSVEAEPTPGVWYFVISGSLVVEDDPVFSNQKQFSELGPGNIFGGYQTLTDTASPLSIRASKGCELLELSLANLANVREKHPHLVSYLASLMGESPLSAAAAAVPPANDSGSQSGMGSPISQPGPQGPLSDIRLQSIKSAFASIEFVWKEICFEEESVSHSQFTAFQPYLGEVGSELFKKLFETRSHPDNITKKVYWEFWIDFLTQETFGKRTGEDTPTSKPLSHDLQAQNAVLSLKSERRGGKLRIFALLDDLFARLARSRRLKDRFFEDQVLERYESSFQAITGDLGTPLPRSSMDVFLERLFPDFEYPISQYNCDEFAQVFGRDGVRSKLVTFSDIRKILMERSKNPKQDGFFVDGALNPDTLWYSRWIAFVRVLSIYHFVAAPVRLSFSPWSSMLDVRCLATDGVADLLTLLHVAVLANTAYRNSRSQWVTGKMKLFRRIHPSYVLPALPLDWFAYLFGASMEQCDWLRMAKLLLPYQILIHDQVRGSRRSVLLRLVKLFLFFLALVHLAACAWFYIGWRAKDWHSFPPVSWLEAGDGLQNVTYVSYANRYGMREHPTVWDRYLISVYWVTSTLTAYGIVGDLLPQNVTELIFTMVVMVLSITVYGFLIGEVSTVFMMQDERTTKIRAQLGTVESFVRGSGLDDNLRDEIKQHLKATRARNSVDQASIMKRMSRSLQVEVSSYTTRGFLDGVPLFAGCSPQLIDAVSVLLSEVTFGPEDYAYRAGEVAREMYFVISGSIEEVVESEKGEKVESTVKAGGNVGVLSFFFGMRHLSSARAGKLAGATCLQLSRQEFLDMLKLYPEDEGRIAQSAMVTFESAQSVHSSRKASSQYAASVRSGRSSRSRASSAAASSAAASSTAISGTVQTGSSNAAPSDDSGALNHAMGGSGLRQRMATLKKRRENKRIFGILMAAAKGDLVRLRATFAAEGGEAEVNVLDHFKRTPLHVAASEGQLEVLRLLMDIKANPDARDRFNNTPLHDAVRHKHDEVAEYIRKCQPGAMLVLKGHEIGGLMCQSAFEGDVGHIKRLIENKASPSACDYDRRSALHLAACEGHFEMAKLLLEAKADPHARDRFGGGPLDDAVRHGHGPLQALLTSWGARLTGDHYAVKACEAAARGDLDTIKTLVENGVDTSLGDYDGRTALHLAASEGEVSILDYLLKQDPPVDANPVDRLDGTPLEDACRHGHRVAVIMLEGVMGMRRGEQQLASLIVRYMAAANPDRVDLLMRARRCHKDQALRASARQAAAEACTGTSEFTAMATIRDQILPNIRGSVERLSEQLVKICAFVGDDSPTAMRALMFQDLLPSRAAHKDPTDGKTPMAAAQQVLSMIPELLAAVAPAREAMDAPLPPSCRLVHLLGFEFRREAAVLRAEIKTITNFARILRRMVKTAQSIFRTRTFRSMFRTSVSKMMRMTKLVRRMSKGSGGQLKLAPAKDGPAKDGPAKDDPAADQADGPKAGTPTRGLALALARAAAAARPPPPPPAEASEPLAEADEPPPPPPPPPPRDPAELGPSEPSAEPGSLLLKPPLKFRGKGGGGGEPAPAGDEASPTPPPAAAEDPPSLPPPPADAAAEGPSPPPPTPPADQTAAAPAEPEAAAAAAVPRESQAGSPAAGPSTPSRSEPQEEGASASRRFLVSRGRIDGGGGGGLTIMTRGGAVTARRAGRGRSDAK